MAILSRAAQFAAGFGDTASLGATRYVRQWMGIDDVVDYCSGWYSAGGWTATAVEVVMGGYGLYKAAGKYALRRALKEGVEKFGDDGIKALSKVPDFANKRLAAEHYAKHVKGVIDKAGKQKVSPYGIDLPEFKNFNEYVQAARKFNSGGPGNGILEGVRAGGDILRFEQSTGYFGVRTADGVIRTFFRPSGGLQYFLSQF